MFDKSRARAGADAGGTARPAEAAAGGGLGQRGPVRAGDLGGFRPPLDGGNHHRRDAVLDGRDQARHQALEEMDGAAADRDRAAVHAGEKPPDPAAARRRRHHRALELSAAADARARDRRDRRRQPGDDQAERADAAVFRAAEGSHRGQVRRHRNDGDRRRGRNRKSLCLAAVRSSGIHRLDQGRPTGRGSRRAQPDADHARARRQVARDRRPLRRSSTRRPSASPTANCSMPARPASRRIMRWCRTTSCRLSPTRWSATCGACSAPIPPTRTTPPSSPTGITRGSRRWWRTRRPRARGSCSPRRLTIQRGNECANSRRPSWSARHPT